MADPVPWPPSVPGVARPRPLLPAPPRAEGRFALMPLADIMFQLLVFFMLSTSLAPYALLPLGAPAPAEDTPGAAQTPSTGPAPAQIVWHLQNGHLREGARSITFATLPDRLAALQAQGVEDLVVVVSAAARAQDLATVLEALRGPGPRRVQLVSF